MADCGEQRWNGQILQIEGCCAGANRGAVVGIAGGRHLQVASGRIGEGLVIVASRCDRRVEDFEGLEIQLVQNGRPDPGASLIERMGRDCYSTRILDPRNDVAGRRAL